MTNNTETHFGIVYIYAKKVHIRVLQLNAGIVSYGILFHWLRKGLIDHIFYCDISS